MKSVLSQASGPPSAAAIVRPADLSGWVGALPYANPGAVLRELDSELSLLNAAEVKPSVRFELLELHAGAYVRLLNALSATHASRGVSAVEQHRSFAETARRLTLRMADGYKLVVDGTAARKASLFAKRRSDAAPIQRVVLFLCFSLNHYYDQYLPTEARVWMELAKLYQLAGERDALDRSVSRGDHRQEFGKPISHLYKLALLTGLADPYHHGPGEVWKVFELMGECADAAHLGPEAPAQDAEGVFVIDPDGVERAKPLQSEAGAEAVNAYYLDTKSTTERLQEMHDQAIQDQGEDFTSARAKQQFTSILNRVVRSLKEPAQRSNDRKPIATPVNLAVGITATQNLIDGSAVVGTEATFTAGPDAPVQAGEQESDEESEADRVAVLKMIDPRSGATVDIGVAAEERKRLMASKQNGKSDEESILATYGTEPWQVTNRSRRGVGIMRHDAPRIPLCVGEIVSFATKKNAVALGVVRWLTVDEAGVYRAGIEIIGKRADPVRLRGAQDEDNPSAARPALALPFFGADEKVAALAALPGTFSEQGVLIVESPDRETQVWIEMTDLVDVTPSCERFSYRIAPRKA